MGPRPWGYKMARDLLGLSHVELMIYMEGGVEYDCIFHYFIYINLETKFKMSTCVCMPHDHMLDFYLPQDLLSPTMQDVPSFDFGHGAEHMHHQRQQEINGGHFNTSELNAPEYSTDDFRMFCFKVERCSKRFVHDWRSCPFAHPTENARRRDPRKFKYVPIPCPEYKRGICLRGDACPYSHGVYECWLHPAKYRTQLCKEGPYCRRPVCFFAHNVRDLRQPTHVFEEDGQNEFSAQKGVVEGLSTKSDEEEAINNKEGDCNQTSSEHNSSDSGGNNFEAADMVQEPKSPSHAGVGSIPGTPVAARAERSAPMATSGDVSLLGIPSPSMEDIAYKNEMRSASLDTHHNHHTNGEYRRRSVDCTWNSGNGVTVGVPVNEQPLVSTQGPRMSNAVARKLGLAPSRTSSSTSNGVVSPPRRSFEIPSRHNNIRRSSCETYGDRDLVAPFRHIERVVTSASTGQASSLLNTMEGIENVHAANWLENSNGLDSFDSLVNSLGSMNMGHNGMSMDQQQHSGASYLSQGFALPANLDEFEHVDERSNI